MSVSVSSPLTQLWMGFIQAQSVIELLSVGQNGLDFVFGIPHAGRMGLGHVGDKNLTPLPPPCVVFVLFKFVRRSANYLNLTEC